MDTILGDLASQWNNLDKAQQVALAQTVGGARQYTTLVSLMENWDKFQKNLRTEAGSAGTLDKQAEIYANSWQAAKDKVTALICALDDAFAKENCTKGDIVKMIGSYLPNFEHIETGKSLDGKM